MRALLAALMLVCTAPAAARGDNWSKVDVGLEATFGAVLVADYVQTRDIVQDGRESNPVMGKSGERMSPESYFASAAALHLVTAHLLPGRWRTLFQGVTIGIEVKSLHQNFGAGYTVGGEW